MYGAGDVRVEDVPDPAIQEPTDAIVRILRAAICGSDLHPYHGMPATGQGRNMGHEFLGIIEDAGAAVTGLRRRWRRPGRSHPGPASRRHPGQASGQ